MSYGRRASDGAFQIQLLAPGRNWVPPSRTDSGAIYIISYILKRPLADGLQIPILGKSSPFPLLLPFLPSQFFIPCSFPLISLRFPLLPPLLSPHSSPSASRPSLSEPSPSLRPPLQLSPETIYLLFRCLRKKRPSATWRLMVHPLTPPISMFWRLFTGVRAVAK